MTALKLSKILNMFGPATVVMFADEHGKRVDVNYVKRMMIDGVEVVVFSEQQLPS